MMGRPWCLEAQRSGKDYQKKSAFTERTQTKTGAQNNNKVSDGYQTEENGRLNFEGLNWLNLM